MSKYPEMYIQIEEKKMFKAFNDALKIFKSSLNNVMKAFYTPLGKFGGTTFGFPSSIK